MKLIGDFSEKPYCDLKCPEAEAGLGLLDPGGEVEVGVGASRERGSGTTEEDVTEMTPGREESGTKKGTDLDLVIETETEVATVPAVARLNPRPLLHLLSLQY